MTTLYFVFWIQNLFHLGYFILEQKTLKKSFKCASYISAMNNTEYVKCIQHWSKMWFIQTISLYHHSGLGTNLKRASFLKTTILAKICTAITHLKAVISPKWKGVTSLFNVAWHPYLHWNIYNFVNLLFHIPLPGYLNIHPSIKVTPLN